MALPPGILFAAETDPIYAVNSVSPKRTFTKSPPNVSTPVVNILPSLTVKEAEATVVRFMILPKDIFWADLGSSSLCPILLACPPSFLGTFCLANSGFFTRIPYFKIGRIFEEFIPIDTNHICFLWFHTFPIYLHTETGRS